MASDQHLHCLPLIQNYFKHVSIVIKWACSIFRVSIVIRSQGVCILRVNVVVLVADSGVVKWTLNLSTSMVRG